jgi:hypothetical protein
MKTRVLLRVARRFGENQFVFVVTRKAERRLDKNVVDFFYIYWHHREQVAVTTYANL